MLDTLFLTLVTGKLIFNIVPQARTVTWSLLLWCWHGLLDLGLGLSVVWVSSERAKKDILNISFNVLVTWACWPAVSFSLLHSLFSFSCNVTLLLRCNFHTIQSTIESIQFIALGEPRQEGCYKCETSLVCVASSRLAQAAQWQPTSNKWTVILSIFL